MGSILRISIGIFWADRPTVPISFLVSFLAKMSEL